MCKTKIINTPHTHTQKAHKSHTQKMPLPTQHLQVKKMFMTENQQKYPSTLGKLMNVFNCRRPYSEKKYPWVLFKHVQKSENFVLLHTINHSSIIMPSCPSTLIKSLPRHLNYYILTSTGFNHQCRLFMHLLRSGPDSKPSPMSCPYSGGLITILTIHVSNTFLFQAFN